MHTYLKLLFRGIFKRKLTTSISLFGFSIALTLIMFIALFLKNELTNDSFHKNFSQIYRVDSEYKTNIYPLTAAPMADWLSDNFSEVKQSARMFSPYFKSLYYVKKDNISYEIENPVFVDPSFFDVFSFPIKAGTISEDFDTKNAIVLTEPLAKKLFGNDNPIGKTLQYSGKDGFTVVAVLESLPSNSTMHFDLLLPFASFNDFNTFSLEDWGRLTYQTFVITDQEPLAFESQINLKMKDQFPDKEFKYLVSPLKDIHFSPNAEYDNIFRHESRTSLHLFMAIAIAILLIAVINFLNLTLASSSLRTKELKIRQIEGANRVQLSMQYIIEAVLISLMASFVAIAFIEVLFPSFNNVLESPLATSQIREPWFYLIIFSISIVTGILSGIYPALKFSKTNNISLNNKSGTSAFSSKWNSILLVFQFAASIILVISTLVIIKQSNYIQNCQLGFNKEHVLYLRLDDNLIQHKQTILDKLENLPEIISATTCDFIPGQAYSQQLLSVNLNGEEKT